jgi:hypothetical protein
LGAELRVRVPARVEEDEQRLDAVAGGDPDELRDAAQEAGAVLGPQLIVQEHPDGVEPDLAGHLQLTVDAPGVVGACLPHLDLVARGGGDVVGAHQPALLPVPGVGLVRGPPRGCRRDGRDVTQRRSRTHESGELQDGPTAHL